METLHCKSRMKSFGRRQTGAALVIGLILLLVMTLLGVTAMRGTTLQERMSGALHDQNLAFQAAESALRQGEQVLGNAINPNLKAKGWYDYGDNRARPDWKDKPTDTDAQGDGVLLYEESDMGWKEEPQFYIERLPPVVIDGDSGGSMALGDGAAKEEYELYRVVARGFGQNTGTVAVVESVYRR